MRRTVTVLQDDIDNGVQLDAKQCPVARAVRRDLADLVSPYGKVSACQDLLWIGKGSAVRTPLEVKNFMGRFDCGYPVESFKFEIEIEVPQ